MWVAIDGEECIGSDIGDRDTLCEIGRQDVEGRQVKDVLPPSRVRVKVPDPVMAEAGRKHEAVLAAATCQPIIATSAIELVVASATLEPIIAAVTNQCVGELCA